MAELYITIQTEDGEVVGIVPNLSMAERFCQEYADAQDGGIALPAKRVPYEINVRTGPSWRVECYPRNTPERSQGFTYDLFLNTVPFYPDGVLFPKDLGDDNFPDLPAFLRRQAE